MSRCPLWFLALMLLATAAWAQNPRVPEVVVRPFEVYNAPDLQPLVPGLQAMLASRLSGKGYAVTTSTEPGPGKEAWTVRTTITYLGGVYSIDASLEPVQAKADGTRTYETADSAKGLMPALESIAGHLKAALGRLAPAAPNLRVAGEAGAPAIAPPSIPSPQTPRPLLSESAPAASTQPWISQVLGNHRLGATLPGEAYSLVVADADGDGAPEILVLTEASITAYRDDGTQIGKVWESPTPAGFKPKLLSAGDVDGNGIPELFVAGMDGSQPVSQALEWFGSALAPKGGRISGFVRAVPHPSQGVLLLGRTQGPGQDLFAPGLRRFASVAGGYEPKGNFAAPGNCVPVNLNFLQLFPDQPAFTSLVTADDRLRLYDGAGKELFESKEPVKGSRVVVVGEPSGARDTLDEPRYHVQGKTVAWNAPDGATYVVTARNYASVSRIFQRIDAFSHGQLQALRWDGLTLATAGEGPKIPGYIPDLDMGPPAGSRTDGTTLYAALVQEEGTMQIKRQTRIVAYDLPGPQQAARP